LPDPAFSFKSASQYEFINQGSRMADVVPELAGHVGTGQSATLFVVEDQWQPAERALKFVWNDP